MISRIFSIQFMCLTIFFAQPLSKFSLIYLLIWNHPLHTPYISSLSQCPFCNTCLYDGHLFCFSTKIMASIPNLSLFQLFTWNSTFYLDITHLSNHSYFCLLKFHLIFFYTQGVTSMQHTTLHTTAVLSPSDI